MAENPQNDWLFGDEEARSHLEVKSTGAQAQEATSGMSTLGEGRGTFRIMEEPFAGEGSGTPVLPKQPRNEPKTRERDILLGEKCQLSGVVHLEGQGRVDGLIEGELSSFGDLLIGETGIVCANIKASILKVSGQVFGNIDCDKRLELLEGAFVRGDISAPVMVIEDGVHFDGYCKMFVANPEIREGRSLPVSSHQGTGGHPETKWSGKGVSASRSPITREVVQLGEEAVPEKRGSVRVAPRQNDEYLEE